MSLFAGSLGNFGAKARAVGLTTLTTSSMPSKPTDFGFFNVLSIQRQNEPDPAHIRDFVKNVRASSFGGASSEERQLRVGVFSTACQKGQYITTALMYVCLVHKPRRRFSSLSNCPSWSALRWTCCKYQLHHEHSGKGGSRSAPQPLIDTIVHLICVTLYRKGPRFSHTDESRNLQHLPCYTDGVRPKVLPKSRGPPVIPPPPSLPPPALLPAPPPLLRERFPEYHDWTALKRKRLVGQLLPFHPNKKVSQREVGAGSGNANAQKCASPTAPNRDGAGRSSQDDHAASSSIHNCSRVASSP